MSEDNSRGPVRDAGRIAVLLVGPLLATLINRGEPAEDRTSAARLGREAGVAPRRTTEATTASALRIMAWLLLTGVLVGCFVVASFARGPAGGGLDRLLVGIMIVTAYAGLFGTGSFLVSVARISFIEMVGYRGFPAEPGKLGRGRWADQERRRRAAIARQGGPSRIIRWMATASLLDVVPALVFALLFGPLIVADIPR